MIHAELARRYGFTPDAPIDATHALPPVRPAAERAAERDVERTGPIYPDQGPDLHALRHTRWPDTSPPEHVSAADVYEQGGAVLRRLAVLEAKVDQVLAHLRGQPW